MTDVTESRRATRSEASRALMKERALVRGEHRSEDVRERVRGAMRAIEQEMDANNGIYPHNKGAVSSAEVARRADVHPTTFFSPKQRDLGVEVKHWLEALKSRKVVGRGPVRRDLIARVADWKREFDGLAQSHRETELDLQQAQADLAQARAEMEKLQQENRRLQQMLSATSGQKVVPLLRPKGAE